jgi:long-chain acyl-CoA synthetase
VSDTGEDVGPGEIGEIIVRGPNVMQGYWNKPEETTQALRDRWYYSGDMAFFDTERFIFLVDRKKDMIISGGENVYSTEVENAIYTHPAVLEAAVIGVPDPQWGEAVKAVVVLRSGQTLGAAELIEHCRAQIAGYKLPKSVDFLAALPKSGAGKVLKRELRAPYWTGHERRIH